MIRVLTSTVARHGRSRASHRRRTGSRARTRPAWSSPRKPRVTRVGYELFTAAPSRPIIETGYGPAHTRSDRADKTHGGQAEPPPRAAEAPVEPRVAELVDRGPHEEVVREADGERAGPQAHEVDDRGDHEPADDGRPARALPEPQGGRGDRAHDDVRGEEPGRDERDLRGGAQRRRGHAGRRRDRHGRQPGEEQGHHGHEEAPQAAAQPPRVRRAAGPGAPPRQGVGVPADEEEHRHHLEDPGQRVGPRREVEQVPRHELAVADRDRGDEPVAEDDDEDGSGAQEVDDPVARGRCRGGEVADGGEVHGDSVTPRSPIRREYAYPFTRTPPE